MVLLGICCGDRSSVKPDRPSKFHIDSREISSSTNINSQGLSLSLSNNVFQKYPVTHPGPKHTTVTIPWEWTLGIFLCQNKCFRPTWQLETVVFIIFSRITLKAWMAFRTMWSHVGKRVRWLRPTHISHKFTSRANLCLCRYKLLCKACNWCAL